MADKKSRVATRKRGSGPSTSGSDWAIVLCPLCLGRGVADMIVLRGTGASESDPVIFPAHGDGECLDEPVTARVMIDAMRAAGAETSGEVSKDPAMAAAVLRIIRGRH